MDVPVIDITALVQGTKGSAQVAEALQNACKNYGFFYITGHSVDQSLQDRLEALSWQFFRLPPEQKQSIAMSQGGRAWRGYFGVGQELTSGKPDIKEGLYFGEELSADHPLVLQKTPLHGRNLFPNIPQFKETLLAYLQAMTSLGHVLMSGVALSLGLPKTYFRERYLKDPLILIRIFHYPAPTIEQQQRALWGVGEHTDYGVLTILKQDPVGGLQVKSQDRWIDAPYIPGTFICNIGDMLDRLTAGYYRSTPHRVWNPSHRGRLSFPFFFDPNYHCAVDPVDMTQIPDFKKQSFKRWDAADPHAFRGTYGDYLLNKVAKVFPYLLKEVK